MIKQSTKLIFSHFTCLLLIFDFYCFLTYCLLVWAHTTTSLDYLYGFLNIAWEADCERLLCYDLLTYLPTQTRFALGSRLDRQWSPLRGYRPLINPSPSL